MSEGVKVCVILAVVAALYGLLFWGIVRWLRHRLLKRAQLAAEALAARGAKILAVRPSPAWFKPAEVEMELDGKHAFFHVRRFGRDWILLSVHLDAPPLPSIWIRPEQAAERLGKAMGLHREVQLGDPAFDDAAFIASNAPDDLVREALAAPAVRGAVLQILGLGYQVEMSPEGLRATRMQLGMSPFDPAPVPEALRALAVMLAGLPRVDPARLTHPRISRAMTPAVVALIGSMVVFGLFMGAVPALQPPVNDLSSLEAMAAGFLPWLLVVFGLSRALRGRPFALTELVVSSLFSLIGVCALTATGLFLVNARLDGSPAETHVTRVLWVAGRDSEARVEPWDPTRTWQKISVPRAVHRTLRKGDALEVDVHPGALGWPWLSDVRKVAKP
jgi:hypothetical protein